MSQFQRPDDPACKWGDLGMWTNVGIVGVTVLALLLVFRFRPFAGARPERHPAAGKRLPVVEVEPLSGDNAPLTRDDLRGQVVLVSFWGAWSDHCRKELPHLAEIRARYRDRPDFRLLSIACVRRPDDNVASVGVSARALLGELKLDLPSYTDPSGSTMQSFQAMADLELMPTNYLVDRAGVIRFAWAGFREGVEKAIVERIDELLEEPFRGSEDP